MRHYDKKGQVIRSPGNKPPSPPAPPRKRGPICTYEIEILRRKNRKK